jgi:hypothetical protein
MDPITGRVRKSGDPFRPGNSHGVLWNPLHCMPVNLFYTRYIQVATPRGGSPFVDNEGRFERLLPGHKPPTPYYPPDPGFPEATFTDDPSLSRKVDFEVCQVCVCRSSGRITRKGPCKNWTWPDYPDSFGKETFVDPDAVSLDAAPGSSLPSEAFQDTVNQAYPGTFFRD